MDVRFLEVTNGPRNWGKFMLARWTVDEWMKRSEVDPSELLLMGRGWSPQHFLMLDLQTGEGAVFSPGGYAKSDLNKHKVWVCPLFEPTLQWLHDRFREHHGDGDGWWQDIPTHVDLPDAEFQWAGYRREGNG